MLINDTNRKELAKYLADYIDQEMELLEPPWEADRMIEVLESGLEAYESINQPKQYVISRSIANVHLNGQEFLLSDNKDVRLFDSIAEAKENAHSVGITEEDFDNTTFNICEYLPESGDYVVI